MANDTAWQEGWQLGTERRAEQRAHKQAMSDAEFQEKHNEIQGMIDNLQTRLSTVPKDSPDYLKAQDQLAQALQQRDEHWKSLDHPNAILALGKKLGRDLLFKKEEPPIPVSPPVYGQPTMEVNGDKIPTGSAYRVQGPQTPAQIKAKAEELQLEGAAPLSPEEKAQQDARANAAGNLVSFQSKVKLYDQQNPHATAPDATEDEKQARQDYINSLLNASAPREQAGDWERIPGKVNGQPTTLLYNKKTGKYKTQTGEDVGQEILDSFAPDPKEAKPSTSKFGVNVESYKKLHGIPADQDLTPDQLNFVEQQIALSSAAPTTNITNSLKQDINGAWVPVTETNQHIPGFGVILRDPLGPAQPQGNGASSQNATQQTMVTPNPKGLKEPGNLPIWNRPTVKNDDGTYSSEYSTSFQDPKTGYEVLVPTVVGGKFLTPDGKKPKPGTPEEKAMFQKAWQHYIQTGENLGKFDNAQDADAYAKILHSRGSNPSAVKKQAEAIKPTSTPAPRHAGVSVGKPIMQGRTPEYTNAEKDYNTAVGLATAAHNAEKAPPDVKAGLQREIAGRLQNTLEKRFNLQAMDNLINHYGIANNFETWLSRTETGALPDNVFHEVVAMADNNVVEKKSALQSATPPPLNGGSNSQSNPDIDAIVNIINQKHSAAPPAH